MKRYLGYECSGRRGSVRQLLINGEAFFYDSVIGDGDGDAVNRFERTLGDAIHYETTPLFGDFDQAQMEEYVGA
jgi:hypothetical protein